MNYVRNNENKVSNIERASLNLIEAEFNVIEIGTRKFPTNDNLYASLAEC